MSIDKYLDRVMNMMRLKEKLNIRCDVCNHVNEMNPDFIDCEVSTYERSMGPETVYEFQDV